MNLSWYVDAKHQTLAYFECTSLQKKLSISFTIAFGGISVCSGLICLAFVLTNMKFRRRKNKVILWIAILDSLMHSSILIVLAVTCNVLGLPFSNWQYLILGLQLCFGIFFWYSFKYFHHPKFDLLYANKSKKALVILNILKQINSKQIKRLDGSINNPNCILLTLKESETVFLIETAPRRRTFSETLKSRLPFFHTDLQKIACHVIDCENELLSLIEIQFSKGLLTKESLENCQKTLNRIFKQAKLEANICPDLYISINSDWMSCTFSASDRLESGIYAGTHNSGAYIVVHRNTVALQWYLKLASMISVVLPPVRKFLDNWTICNSSSIFDQLRLGIRHFDLRISWNRRDQKFYVTHTFTCVQFEHILQQFLAFLIDHPKEIVFIQMKKDWEHRNNFSNHLGDKLFLLCKDVFNLKLVKRKSNHNIHDFTFGQLWEQQQNIFLISDIERSQDFSDFVWSEAVAVESTWHNTSSVQHAISKLNEWLNTKIQQRSQTIHQSKHEQSSNVCPMIAINYVLTPSATEIKPAALHYLFPLCFPKPRKGKRNLRDITKSIFDVLFDHLNQHLIHSVQHFHFVDVDFPQKTCFVLNIIELNKIKNSIR